MPRFTITKSWLFNYFFLVFNVFALVSCASYSKNHSDKFIDNFMYDSQLCQYATQMNLRQNVDKAMAVSIDVGVNTVDYIKCMKTAGYDVASNGSLKK